MNTQTMAKISSNHLDNMDQTDPNKTTYEQPAIVDYYDADDRLHKPEQTFFKQVQPYLSNWNMLDIGVGGGRTAHHFGKHVKSYLGIDYSDGMVLKARKKFTNNKNIAIQKMDARNMASIKPNQFDFILYSFNGIDYMTFSERQNTLTQIHRVAKPNAVFAFSTHNLFYLNKLLQIPKFSFNFDYLYQLKRFFKLYSHNGSKSKLLKENFVFINDGAHDFGLRTCYIQPEIQLCTLKEVGFTDCQVYSLSNGQMIPDQIVWSSIEDSWLFYACRVVKS